MACVRSVATTTICQDGKAGQASMPPELHAGGGSVHKVEEDRKRRIKQCTLDLLDKSYLESMDLHSQAEIAQLLPKQKADLELIARIIVTRALDEPQVCKACVSLSSVLHRTLPALPCKSGNKVESFMHSLLDAFQAEFESLLLIPSQLQQKDRIHDAVDEHRAAHRRRNRMLAVGQFAGHLHCQGLLGKAVVSHMVQDLLSSGEAESAKELLRHIQFGSASYNGVLGNLDTVPESADDMRSESSKDASPASCSSMAHDFSMISAPIPI